MGKKSASSIQAVEEMAVRLAEELELELVEVVLQKESRGKCLCVYLDKDGGLTLDDCEKYHKRIQPLLEDVEYDFLEVSSPGIDRPIQTLRDFEKNRGNNVEVRLFKPQDGAKAHTGKLHAMDGETVTIRLEDDREMSFPRKAVAIIKPIIDLDGLEDEEI